MRLEFIKMADESEVSTRVPFVDLTDLEIIRWADGPKVFGLGLSRLREKIIQGLIPQPIPLTADGRALGWTRQMIREHHEAMARLAAERAKPQPEPAGLREARTIRKEKLTPPSKNRRRAQPEEKRDQCWIQSRPLTPAPRAATIEEVKEEANISECLHKKEPRGE
jgi:hypothetical protein